MSGVASSHWHAVLVAERRARNRGIVMTGSSIVYSRRRLIARGTALSAAVGVGLWSRASFGKDKESEEEEVSPAEDLMREHGVLERLLLVYEASLARLAERDAAPLPVVVKTADLTRRFIEDYHEKLEEEFLFPRFEKAGTLVELVQTLRVQHQRGRNLTDEVQRLAEAGGAPALGEQSRLRVAVQEFVRMYRPHAAREDTVLFPAFRKLVPEKQYAELGEQFEDKEHVLFGKEGFEAIVVQVAELEKTLGIYDLNSLTRA
jgi:hemerythrin-like domain-containing protein